MPQRAPLLEIRGLCIEGESEDGWREIVKDIDLTLRRREVLGIIGESGAGKSTLGLAAMGCVRPGCRITAGSVRFDGLDLVRMREAEKRKLWGVRIAYVAQMCCRFVQSVASTHRPICRGRPRAWSDGERTGETRTRLTSIGACGCPIPSTSGSAIPTRSLGGQLQRAMTAMAMSCRPDLIIFDEPTTALDVTTQIEVLAAIKDVVRQFQTAAIYISHDLAVVAQMADRVMVMRYGELVEEAPTSEMLDAS